MSSAVRPLPVLVPPPGEVEPASQSNDLSDLLPPADPSASPPQIAPSRLLALRIALGVSAVAVVWVLWPYWGWLVLAAWSAALARPLLVRMQTYCGGRRRAAAIITIVLCMIVVVPVAVVVASLTVDAVDLVGSLFSADSGRDALTSLVQQGDSGPPLVDAAQMQEFARAHADAAVGLALTLTGSLVEALLGFMVLFSGAYVLLVRGPALFTWVEGLAPASHRTMIRLRDAFIETGRGLLIGSGLTGLVQAVIATVLYFAFDVPRAFVLGFLTLLASVIPGVGTALVWVPIAIGMALTGHMPQAVALAVLSTIFVAGIDNVIRPFFVRWGQLELSPFVVMVSVFGGLAAVGPWGMLLGPIIVRLALEVLRISREEHVL